MSATPSADARTAALAVLMEVLQDGRSLDPAIESRERALADPRDRALCRALAYGVLRHHRRLGALRDHCLRSPLRSRDRDVALVVELGLYQLLAMQIPPHAAVSATVAIVQGRGKRWATKLVNAVLRRFQRERSACLAAVDSHPAVAHSVPDWLYARLSTDWPAALDTLLVQQNERAPMTLRVNRRRTEPQAMAEALAAEGIATKPLTGWADALVLEKPVGLEQLPGFATGELSVQDGSAQLAADVLDAEAGHRVLDACAAPGGKSAQLLERADVRLLALDHDATRLARVTETLDRLGLTADCVVGDAGQPAAWWDGQAFDRILLDAPCSGTGVIRRHPDIKWLRRDSDIAALQAGQQRLLEALWPLLAPGGRLVYATCSVLRAENEAVVEAFMAGHEEARAVPVALPVGQSVGYGHQILTGEAGVDGFYYACLEKH